MSEDRFAAAADPIVVVGMAVEAPGGIDTAESYWELLSHGREALSPFPTDRGWAVRELFAGSRRNGFQRGGRRVANPRRLRPLFASAARMRFGCGNNGRYDTPVPGSPQTGR